MIVNWIKKNAGILTIPCMIKKDGKSVNTGTLVLVPGSQYIPNEKWEQAKPACDQHIKDGLITITMSDKEEKNKDGVKVKKPINTPADDIRDLTLKSAEELIKQTFNIETLNMWLDIETRESLSLLMRKQIDIVNPNKKR